MAFLLLSLEFSAPTRVARMALIEHNNNPDFTRYSFTACKNVLAAFSAGRSPSASTDWATRSE
jgi:hypothetical protein